MRTAKTRSALAALAILALLSTTTAGVSAGPNPAVEVGDASAVAQSLAVMDSPGQSSEGIVGRVLAQATGFLEICKQATGAGLTSSDIFTFTITPAAGAAQTVNVPAGACSSALQVAVGNATITETAGPNFEGQPAFTLTGITVAPTARLVTSNVAARSVTVQIVAGDVSTATVATFTNQTLTGQIKVCKVAGTGVTVGTNFTFTVGTETVTVPAGAAPGGNCVLATTQFNVRSQVTIQETGPALFAASDITVAPATRLVTGSLNLAGRQVAVTVGTGTTDVTFTDRAVTATPTPTNTPTRTNTPTITLTPTVTRTPTSTATLTAPQHIAIFPTPTISGTPAVPCAARTGDVCVGTGTGGTGFAVNTSGGMTFNITALAGPANTIPGGVPAVFIPTTAGVEGFLSACSAVGTAAPFTTTCTGTTAGVILQGASASVVYPTRTSGTVVGPITFLGPGPSGAAAVAPIVPPAGLPAAIPQVAIPAVPRPPVQFIPSAPGPLLPPIGRLGPLQAPAQYPEIPVIPESDTVVLLLGGLAALGAVAVVRRRRRDD